MLSSHVLIHWPQQQTPAFSKSTFQPKQKWKNIYLYSSFCSPHLLYFSCNFLRISRKEGWIGHFVSMPWRLSRGSIILLPISACHHNIGWSGREIYISTEKVQTFQISFLELAVGVIWASKYHRPKLLLNPNWAWLFMAASPIDVRPAFCKESLRTIWSYALKGMLPETI